MKVLDDRQFLSLDEAVREAASQGISTRMLVGVSEAAAEAVLVLWSADPATNLVLLPKVAGHYGDPETIRKQETGPDQWDCPIRLRYLKDKFLLRLSRETHEVDVPVLSGVHAILRSHGLVDDTSLVGEPFLERALLQAAIQHLGPPQRARAGEVSSEG